MKLNIEFNQPEIETPFYTLSKCLETDIEQFCEAHDISQSDLIGLHKKLRSAVSKLTEDRHWSESLRRHEKREEHYSKSPGFQKREGFDKVLEF